MTLSPELVTLINVFTVEPENQQQFLELFAARSKSSPKGEGRCPAM
jgi:hypothetical protein